MKSTDLSEQLTASRPEGVGLDWWNSVLRIAASSRTRDLFDKRTRMLIHDVYQARQTLEGNALTTDRKAMISELRLACRRAFHAIHSDGAM